MPAWKIQASLNVCFDFTVACQLSELISNKTVHFLLIQLGMSAETFPFVTVKHSELTHDWH